MGAAWQGAGSLILSAPRVKLTRDLPFFALRSMKAGHDDRARNEALLGT